MRQTAKGAFAAAMLLTVSPSWGIANEVAAPAADAPTAARYGLVREAAVDVCEPDGERQYLARLVCPDGRHPDFHRIGNVGMRNDLPDVVSPELERSLFEDMDSPRALAPGETDYHIVDAYEVVCGDAKTVVYVDMYHCAQERPTRAPDGFSIID